jgi:hypothetical protein
MRLLVALIATALCGCSTVKRWVGLDEQEPEKPPVVAVPPQADLNALGTKIDKADSRAAAAVTVAVENAEKPGVVRAEGGIALAHLPKPTPEDVAFARDRASRGDPKAYADQEAKARKFLEQMEADWKRAEGVAIANANELKAARTEIDRLKGEIVRVEKEASRNTWTLLGAGLAAIGAIATAFAGVRVGVPLLLCGLFCGAVPFIINSPWFAWIAGATFGLSALLGLWWLWDKVRDSVNDDGKAEKEVPHP